MVRRRTRTDGNQTDIVKALRKCGVSVRIASDMGNDFPDLITASKGRTVLMEIKDGEAKDKRQRELRSGQVAFQNSWQGEAVLVTSVAEALGVYGITLRGEINANEVPQ